MWVLSVPQHVLACPHRAHQIWPSGLCFDFVRRVTAGEPGRHGRVIGSGVTVSPGGQAAALLKSEAAISERRQQFGIASGTGHHCYCRVVLGCGSHHCRSADVYLLYTLGGVGTTGYSLFERVQVRHEQVERLQAKVIKLLPMAGLARSASRPACTAGWRVLTRPSRHSGKPVSFSTGRTGTPAAVIAAAVLPVDTICTPAACSAVASSVRPALS